MANIKSAKKRININGKKAARNKRIKNHIKSIIKSFDAAIAEGDLESAKTQLDLAEKKYMQAAAKNVYHKNTVSRTISRLNKRFNKAKNA